MNIADGIAGAGLVLLSVIDIRKKLIPVWMIGLMGGLLLVCRLWQGVEIGGLVAGLIPGVLVLVLAVCSEGKIGIGDGLTVCALGLGYTLDRVIGILGGALVFAALTAIVLLVFKKVGREKEMPFIPYLFAGYAVCFLAG